jgi:hypothetical protein
VVLWLITIPELYLTAPDKCAAPKRNKSNKDFTGQAVLRNLTGQAETRGLPRKAPAVVVKKVVAIFYKFLNSVFSKKYVSWLTLLLESFSTFYPFDNSLASPSPESIRAPCLRRVPLCGRRRQPYGLLAPSPHRWIRFAGLLTNLQRGSFSSLKTLFTLQHLLVGWYIILNGMRDSI